MSIESDTNGPYEYWFYTIGANCIQCDSKKKNTHEYWAIWQNQSIPSELFEKWKKDGKFRNGMAVIAGKIWRGLNKGKYLVCIDIDNKKGIEEFLSNFGDCNSLNKLAQKTVVEQHEDNLERAHIYFVVQKPLTKKSGIGTKHSGNDNGHDVPAIEVKSEGRHGIMTVSPSIHKDGQRYEIIGTRYSGFG